MSDGLVPSVVRLLDTAESMASDEDRDRVAAAREQLHGPLRVAIVGKVKAGKSTLLNALVGEKVAPTDASECTKVVTRYRSSHVYRITAFTVDGREVELPFRRDDQQLQFDLGTLQADDVRFVDVEWPTSRLDDLILIDTPGLASATRSTSMRTERFMRRDDDALVGADAVIYLMRHLHPMDLSFLEAFSDGMTERWAAVNSIAVLSRADEVGSARVNAMHAAREIAARYQAEHRVRSLCQVVTPVAGLVAQAAPTLEQDAFDAIADIANGRDADTASLMLSAQRFVGAPGPAASERERRELIDRLGLFGVRLAVELISAGVNTAGTLADELERRSGIVELRSLLAGRFRARAQVLKARSALAAIWDVAEAAGGPEGRQLRDGIRDLETAAHELAEIHLLSELTTDGRTLGIDTDEAARLLGRDGPEPAARLGLPTDARQEQTRAAALAAIERWREVAESPLTQQAGRNVARAVVRSCEGMAFSTGR